jgi:hypothetical protein
VSAVRAWTAHDQQARNLTVDGVHTYYVATAGQSVLVHNCAAENWAHLGAHTDVSTARDTAFIWTNMADSEASTLAESMGGTTLEGALRSRGVVMPPWGSDDPVANEAWIMASARYAASASGRVRALVGPQGIRHGSVFNLMELPTLRRNVKVTEIIQIETTSGRTSTIFSR